jgi:hypothetical protein
VIWWVLGGAAVIVCAAYLILTILFHAVDRSEI